MPQTPDTYRIPNYVQDPKILPLAQWLPDQPAFNNPGFTVALNVQPKSVSSYGPVPSFNAFGYPALPSRPFGMFSNLDQSQNIHVWTGTATKLYHIASGLSAFADVSKVAATYAVSIDNPWQFTLFGNTVIATNGADPPQAFTIGTDTKFKDLSASAPIARYVATVRDFCMFANTNEGGNNLPYRIHWSAIGDPSTWPTPGSNAAQEVQSDFNDIPATYGWIRGIVSGLQSSDAAIFTDKAVLSVNYIGSPAVFSIVVVQGATGCRLSSTICNAHGVAFYLGTDGFYSWDGTNINRIGAQKVDNFFFNDPNDGVNASYLDGIVASADPGSRTVMWSYAGPGSTGINNRILLYQYDLERWSLIKVDTTWLTSGLSQGYTLDQLDSFGTLDSLPFSLDSAFWQGGSPLLLGFNASFQLAAFGGSAMAATLETGEIQPTPGRRTRVTSSRALLDGGSPSITIGSRTNQTDAVSYDTASPTNIWGESPQLIDAQYIRARVTIPAGTSWNHIQGIQLEYASSTRS